MVKKRVSRILCLLLALLLAVSAIPAASHADGPVEVSDMETFKALMSQDGDVSIKLTAHLFEQHGYVKSEIPGGDVLPLWAKILFPWMMAIDHEFPHYYGPNGQYMSGPSGENKDDYEYKMPYWLILGSGSKRIDLQGFSIVVDYPNVHENISTMFLINEGTSLTINDSTGDSGYIHYEGYIFDIEEYDINNYYYATNMYRGLFEVSGGSLTINGGTLEAGRSKKQWVTNAHTKDEYGTTDWYSSYTGNVTKSVNGNAVTVNSGSLTINGGTLLGRGEYRAVINANGGSVRIAEGRIDARGSANCLRISSKANVELVSGVFLLHKNDVVYEGRAQYTETNPYLIHYGTAGQLGFTKENINYDQISVSFMDPRPPRHWMVPNSIVEGDGFDLWNEIVAPYGYETFMIVKPVSHTADINFMAAPGKFQPTINTDSIVVKTNYTCVFQDVATVRARPLYATNFYDVYDFDTMELLGHAVTNINTEVDLCEVMPGIADQFEEGKTYAVFATVIEQYEGAYPYEVRSVACNLFNATSHKPVTITKHPGSGMYVAAAKGGTVTLTAEAANATEAYWEMTEPYYRKLEPTSFLNGKATLTVPVDFEAKYRCQFTNPYYYSAVHETYTYIPTNEVEVAYKPEFELKPGQTKEQTAVQGYDANIILWHNGQEDTGDPYFYGYDYGQAGMYAWYKDGVKLDFQAKNEDGTKRYTSASYWGGGIGLKISQVKASDAGRYECRCGLEDMPFGSGTVQLNVLQSAGWVYNVSLTGMKDLYVGDLPPAVSSIRTNDIRVAVDDVVWANLDSGGHLTAESYYTVKLKANYDARFDAELMWDMDAENLDYAIVSSDSKSAVVEDPHKFEGRGDYEIEDDSVILNQTSFTVYQGRFYPWNDQLKVHKYVCPEGHNVLGYEHKIGGSSVVDSSQLPQGITVWGGGFYGEVKADPGVYKATVRFLIVDEKTGKKYDDCDVPITFTVLPAESVPDGEIVHEHIYGDWTSDGLHTHSSVCTGCGEKTIFPHDWDEGVVTQSPRKDADGTIRYTCRTCGQTRTEPLAYEDYRPPFPEVSDVAVSGNTVTVFLEEYSGSAPDTELLVAVYDADGRFLGMTSASPDKSGQVTVTLPLDDASLIRVFVLEEDTANPQTEVYSETI